MSKLRNPSGSPGNILGALQSTVLRFGSKRIYFCGEFAAAAGSGLGYAGATRARQFRSSRDWLARGDPARAHGRTRQGRGALRG